MLMHLLHGGHEAHGDVQEAGHVDHEVAVPDPQQVVLARYARGEITEEQFRHMLAVLKESGRASHGGY
jgi:uncharacterized membrane protein